MQKSVFIDDNLLLGDCYIKREYGTLKEKIIGGGMMRQMPWWKKASYSDSILRKTIMFHRFMGWTVML